MELNLSMCVQDFCAWGFDAPSSTPNGKNMKSIFASKTVWFNVIMTVIGVVTALQSMPTFQVYAPYFAVTLAIGNVILRVWFTEKSIQ